MKSIALAFLLAVVLVVSGCNKSIREAKVSPAAGGKALYGLLMTMPTIGEIQ